MTITPRISSLSGLAINSRSMSDFAMLTVEELNTMRAMNAASNHVKPNANPSAKPTGKLIPTSIAPARANPTRFENSWSRLNSSPTKNSSRTTHRSAST